MKHVAVMLLALALPARAALDETVIRVPVGEERTEIEVTIYKPSGTGPFPVAILSHGSPRTASDRRTNGRQRMVKPAGKFVAMGYAVVVPTRRGYGASGGEFAENYGTCGNPDYERAAAETARDIRAATDAIRAEP